MKRLLLIAISILTLSFPCICQEKSSRQITSRELIGTWALVQRIHKDGEIIEIDTDNFIEYVELTFTTCCMSEWRWDNVIREDAYNYEDYRVWAPNYTDRAYRLEDNVVYWFVVERDYLKAQKWGTIIKLTPTEFVVEWPMYSEIYRRKQ